MALCGNRKLIRCRQSKIDQLDVAVTVRGCGVLAHAEAPRCDDFGVVHESVDHGRGYDVVAECPSARLKGLFDVTMRLACL